MADQNPFGLEKKIGGDGLARLIGKDDAGVDYVAHTCTGPGVAEADIQALADSDRERTTAHELVQRVVAGQEKHKRDVATEFEESLVEAAGPVVRAGFHGFWGVGYGPGEVNPSQPRRTKYVWNGQTRQLELVEERRY